MTRPQETYKYVYRQMGQNNERIKPIISDPYYCFFNLKESNIFETLNASNLGLEFKIDAHF